MSYEELSQPLHEAGGLAPEALRPASVHSMMCRVSRNIVNAVSRRPANGLELAWFAALTSLSILEPDQYLFGRLCDFIHLNQSFVETDISMIESICDKEEVDNFEEHLAFCRKVRSFDEHGPHTKRKTRDYSMVRYSVGHIFKHRAFQYTSHKGFSVTDLRYVGVIFGYDNFCDQSDSWKENMVVPLHLCSDGHSKSLDCLEGKHNHSIMFWQMMSRGDMVSTQT